MKIINVVGARPNFMKIAPIMEEMLRYPDLEPILLHTGQHYDAVMSKVFFDDLKMPKPDIYLGVGSGSHAEQTAKIMIEFEKICLKECPELVIVVGDVNSTLACSVVAAKLCIPVAHVEAGLRSSDRTMPEEINRLVTDSLSDLLFTTSRDADDNLLREGVPREKIHFVGNVMIDSLLKHKNKAAESDILDRLGLSNGKCNAPRPYATLTLHRPSNVDDGLVLKRILKALSEIAQWVPIVFPIHPRTEKQIHLFGLEKYLSPVGGSGVRTSGIFTTSPLGYLEFLQVVANSAFVLSDSGGIQEETTVLGIPCITLRENTERPITIREGTNVLVGSNPQKILAEARKCFQARTIGKSVPELWDGHTAVRIVKICAEFLLNRSSYTSSVKVD